MNWYSWVQQRLNGHNSRIVVFANRRMHIGALDVKCREKAVDEMETTCPETAWGMMVYLCGIKAPYAVSAKLLYQKRAY